MPARPEPQDARTKRNNTIWGTLVVLVMLGTCSLSAVALARNIIFARNSPSWPVVEGYVLSSGTQPASHQNCDVRVRYRYWVGGRELIGTRASFVAPNNCAEASDMAGRFPADTNVEVHYRPETPEVSVLLPGDPGQGLEILLGLCVLMLAAISAVSAYALYRAWIEPRVRARRARFESGWR